MVELLVVLTIISVLSSVTVVSYGRYVDWARVQRARMELNLMAAALDVYYCTNGAYPDVPSLAYVEWPQVGPWGREYEYGKRASGYILTVSDGEGRKRAEARGENGSSEVFLFPENVDAGR